jgi:hypothetical protein
MRVTSGKSRVRESRLPGSVRAEPNGRATRPRSGFAGRALEITPTEPALRWVRASQPSRKAMYTNIHRVVSE